MCAHGRRSAEGAGDTSEDLTEDDPGIAPGAHERPIRDRPAGGAHGVAVGGLEIDVVERLDDALDRERHIRAGVAVGDRVDVQPIHGLAVPLQRLGEGAHREHEALRTQAGDEIAFREIARHRSPAGGGATGGRWSVSRGFIPLDANVTPRPVVELI
jgi:hypothetical protein